MKKGNIANLEHAQAGAGNPVPKSESKHSGTLVRIKDFNDSKHLVKVTRADDGEPLEKDIEIPGDIKQNKPFEKRAAKTIKTLPTQDGPIMEVSDDQASIRGSSTSGFISDNQFGNIIQGPTSITAAPHEIRVSGVTTLNPLLTTCFPSTIVTPLPVCVWSLPGAGLVGPIAKDIAVVGTLIASLGVG